MLRSDSTDATHPIWQRLAHSKPFLLLCPHDLHGLGRSVDSESVLSTVFFFRSVSLPLWRLFIHGDGTRHARDMRKDALSRVCMVHPLSEQPAVERHSTFMPFRQRRQPTQQGTGKEPWCLNCIRGQVLNQLSKPRCRCGRSAKLALQLPKSRSHSSLQHTA